MHDLDKIIEGCQKGQRSFQKLLYDKYAPILLGICVRYSHSTDEAEDILQEGFIKILKQINKFKKKGSFEGWMRRLMVNTAISNYRKNLKRYFKVDINEPVIQGMTGSWKEVDYTKEELMQVIQSLADGYKMVFNLYAIEGYKHKEIAELLGVDETTSKSQYSRAKKQLQQKLTELNKIREY